MGAKSKRVIIYARVSTSNHEQNPEVQLTELRAYCIARGWDLEKEIIDHGYTGANDNRPGLKELLKLARSRSVDIVLVTKLDRLFRSTKHLILTLQEFTELGIEFVSIRDQIDLTTSAGKLFLHILAAFSQFELDLIKERTIAGLEYAKSKGKILGRPKRISDQEILKLHAKGMSQRAIQQQLGYSKGAIHKAISLARKSPKEKEEMKHLETRGYDA